MKTNPKFSRKKFFSIQNLSNSHKKQAPLPLSHLIVHDPRLGHVVLWVPALEPEDLLYRVRRAGEDSLIRTDSASEGWPVHLVLLVDDVVQPLLLVQVHQRLYPVDQLETPGVRHVGRTHRRCGGRWTAAQQRAEELRYVSLHRS